MSDNSASFAHNMTGGKTPGVMSNDEEDVHFVVKLNTKVQSLVTNF